MNHRPIVNHTTCGIFHSQRTMAGWSALRSSFLAICFHYFDFDWALPLTKRRPPLLTIHLGSIINVTCALLGCAILLYSGFRRKSEFSTRNYTSRDRRKRRGGESPTRDGQGAPPTVIWGYVIDFSVVAYWADVYLYVVAREIEIPGYYSRFVLYAINWFWDINSPSPPPLPWIIVYLTFYSLLVLFLKSLSEKIHGLDPYFFGLGR